LITSPDYRLLTTGDAEPDVQKLIPVGKVDYLKVAHHGSKYQDEQFNLRVNPKIAIISVGKGNKYGHPADKTLRLFHTVYRTDVDGAIALDPKHKTVSSSKVGVLGLPVLWRIA
jgi:competence protein ComEC